MIQITEHSEGIIISVRAQPGAKKQRVVGEHGGALKIAVSAPAEDGKANKALQNFLCDFLQLRPYQVILIAGLGNRSKKFLLRGIGKKALEEKLKSWGTGEGN